MQQEANWYKPAPGEPYRPLIAMPSKLRQADPWLNFCDGLYFTAFDPPHALVTEAALLPPTSAGDPKPVPVPSPTQDPGTKANFADKVSTLKPAILPTIDEPQATLRLSSAFINGKLSPNPQSNNPAASDTSLPDSKASLGYSKQGRHSIQGDDPNQTSVAKHGSDPDQSSDLNQGSNSDPGEASNQSTDTEQGSKTNSNPEDGANQG